MTKQSETTKAIAKEKRKLTAHIKALTAHIKDITECAEKQNYLQHTAGKFWYLGQIRTAYFITRLQDQLNHLIIQRRNLNEGY